jgi:hypothetical protein
MLIPTRRRLTAPAARVLTFGATRGGEAGAAEPRAQRLDWTAGQSWGSVFCEYSHTMTPP